MFIYDTHLPQILDRESYTCEDQHAREMQRLFLPSWHFVAATMDVPGDGDYVTAQLFDKSLVLWNQGGKVQAFHKCCVELAPKPRGNARQLCCGIHGLPLDSATGKASGIGRVRTEFCGPLIFVSLHDEAPDLKAFIGPMWDTMQSLFPADARDVLSLDYEIEANWKVKVENTLESYHVEMVHPKSFSHMPEEKDCHEELERNGSSFHAREEAPARIDRVLDRGVHQLAGAPRDLTYSHYIAFPHVMFAKMRLLCWIETVYPISASRHRVVFRSFYRPTAAGALRSGLGYYLLRAWARRFGKTASREDAAIIPCVQKGLASPTAPSQGLLSIREERLFHFQEYIQRETPLSSALAHTAHSPSRRLQPS
jgi:phenylpropionate dioxygenase-like ring-hydroxylating dioxygenase large terminal subunit